MKLYGTNKVKPVVRKIWFVSFLFSVVLCAVIKVFGCFESELMEFNAKLANLLRGNRFAVRDFDDNGVPTSYFARSGKSEIVPFYVVHYGLIYSTVVFPSQGHDSAPRKDTSLQHWDVAPPPHLVTSENFIHAADWVVRNTVRDSFGQYHLVYNFDWPYPKLKGGILKAPWYSGLTDGYALSLLTRAYFTTGEPKYREAADNLYRSVNTPIDKGGSLLLLPDGTLWVEEYVVPGIGIDNSPKVLNGMIYASFGVYEYETSFKIGRPIYPRFFDSIKKRIGIYDLGWWTAYDEIGTLANIKYHRIHVALLDDMYHVTGDPFYRELKQKWEHYDSSFVSRYLFYGKPSVNNLMILVELAAATLVIVFSLNSILHKYWIKCDE